MDRSSGAGRVRPHLIFEATTRCDLECAYCYNVWRARPGYPRGELSTRETCRLLRQAIREGEVGQVTFSGGEPTLRDDLPDLVATCRLETRPTAVITNGARLDRSLARDLIQMGQSLFELTLLSMRPEVQDRLCGPGAWRRVLRAMDTVAEQGGRLALVHILMRPNAAELEPVMHEAARRGAYVMLNRFNPGGNGLGRIQELQCPPRQLRELLLRADRLAAELDLSLHCGVPVPPCAVRTSDLQRVRNAGCPVNAQSRYPTLDPLGNLRPCNHSPTILGNLREASFLALASRRAVSRVVGPLPEICVPCPAASVCRGGCRAASEQVDGTWQLVDPFVRAAGAPGRPGGETEGSSTPGGGGWGKEGS